MKKPIIKITLLMVVMLIIIAISTVVKAAEPSVSLRASKTEVKVGETFTVDVTAKFDEGLEGFDSILKYNGSKIQFINSSDITEATGGMSEFINNENGLECFSLTRFFTSGTEKNVATLQFKVLDGVEPGETIEIILTDINVNDNDVSNKNIGIKVVSDTQPPVTEKTLTKIEIAEKPTKTTYTEGDTFDKTGMKIIATYSDGTTKVVTSYTISPSGKLSTSDKKITITYTENGVTKSATQTITVKAKTSGNNAAGNQNAAKNNDNTTSDKVIPKTGAEIVLVPITIVAMIGAGAFFKYKKTEI